MSEPEDEGLKPETDKPKGVAKVDQKAYWKQFLHMMTEVVPCDPRPS